MSILTGKYGHPISSQKQHAEEIKQLNDEDMSEKINKIKEINRKRGNPENSFNIAIDEQYNSSTIARRKKAGQNASQSVTIACEMMTEKQYIIVSAVQNKLCWTGAWLRGNDMT